jgi:hypothetical protein
MQIFNLGFGEILFILVIAGVVLGPERIVKFARQSGQFIRSFITSPMWKDVVDTSMEIRQIPQRLIEGTGLQEDLFNIKGEIEGINTNFQGEMAGMKQDLSRVNNVIEGQTTVIQ